MQDDRYIVYLCLQPREGANAARTHVSALVDGLRQCGCRVDLVEPPSHGAGSLPARAWAGLRIQLGLIGRLRRVDVLWTRMHPLAVPSVLAARVLRRQVLIEVNGLPSDYMAIHPSLRFAGVMLHWLLTVQLRLADAVVAVTPGLAAWASDIAERRDVHVVPNGADPDVFRPGLARPADVPERYVLFSGALSPWQGLTIALAATSEPEWPNDVILVIVGDGLLRTAVADAAISSGGRIRYLGERPPERMPAYVANALATIALKDYHDVTAGQSPLKLYESLAAGVPVIASQLHGMSELLREHGAGIVLERPTPLDVATSVTSLVKGSERRRMGARGRAAVVDGHTWAHRVDDLLAILSVGRR